MRHHPAYPSLDGFTAPARATSAVWRILAGSVLIVVIYFALVQLGLGALGRAMETGDYLSLLRELTAGNTPRGMLALLITFAPLLLACFAVTRALHRRSAATLFGYRPVAMAGRVLPPLLVLGVLSLPFAWADPNVSRSHGPDVFLAYAPLALPLLLVQVTAEEVVFRGYLLQQIGARWRSRWAWMGLPSALFALLHLDPVVFGANAIWLVLWAFIFGCLAADLTARTGSLGPAIALHFATNFGALFLVSLYGNLDGLALYTLVIDPRDFAQFAPYLLPETLVLLVTWLLARLMLRV